jgi:hypothetical protein
VYVSFDDGEHWQSLRLNMPATSIRDLVIKDDDIVVGTHGRSFWILDNISLLRQMNAATLAQGNILFAPQQATRVRWNMNPDTPLPQEEPAGQNPPDGAMIDYFLAADATGTVTLEILDGKSKTIRRYSSDDKPYALPADNTPPYWLRPQQILSGKKGSHRFLWDMHYDDLDLPIVFPISATYKNTAPEFRSIWVMPGTYTVKLTVNGKAYTQPLKVRMDPRITMTTAQLQKQFDLSMQCYDGIKQCQAWMTANIANKEKLVSVKRVHDNLARTMNLLQEADMPVTSQMEKAVKESVAQLAILKE